MASTCNCLGKQTLRCRDRSRSEERASKFGIQRNGQPFARKAPRGQASEEECLTEVRGIANSTDSVLMQGLVHGRRSVCDHPKARSELGAMEHQNFLLDMEMIRPAKDEGSFEAYAPYLRDAFDGVTKVIQLTEAKLESGDFSTEQEDGEAGNLEEYVMVLPFELSRTSGA
ncbi:hypothetical protein B296_00054459 [Ensete ventricosum]|uniref:Uncharacterized protein n=1 Tax=Ensete ventricosum TaxID=4639 RepID=A0A426WVF3_ENSVE|nr:hypothetical protein B296_00054459 [Ensete ventricosum]